MKGSVVVFLAVIAVGVAASLAADTGGVALVEDFDRLVPERIMLVQAPYRGDTVVYDEPPPDIEIVEHCEVDEMVFSAAIKDRTPITVSDTFPSDIAAVYCYTRIVGAEDTTAIVHSWYHGEDKVVDVGLPVKSPLWRTWSRKTIAPGGRGEWKVDVIAPDGSVIASKKFFIE